MPDEREVRGRRAATCHPAGPGVRGVLPRRQRAGPPLDAAHPGRDGGRGAPAAAPSAHHALHRHLRGDRHRRGQHPGDRPRRQYSVPHRPAGRGGLGPGPWRRHRGHPRGPRRRRRGGPPRTHQAGQPPPRRRALRADSRGPAQPHPEANNAAEEAFLAIGSGAAPWLTEVGAGGVARPRPKMAVAVALAALHGTAAVDWALGHARGHAASPRPTWRRSSPTTPPPVPPAARPFSVPIDCLCTE